MTRTISMAAIAGGLLLMTSSGQAQTYSPSYPVCLQVYGPLNYTECRYTSIPQCQVTASGRAAQCIVNPFFAGPPEGAPRERRRVR